MDSSTELQSFSMELKKGFLTGIDLSVNFEVLVAPRLNPGPPQRVQWAGAEPARHGEVCAVTL